MWFKEITEHGPNIGYYPKPSKSWLIVKENHLEEALREFHGTGVNITTEGNRHLGAVLGSDENRRKYVSDLVSTWTQELIVLSDIAKSYPHCAYTAYVFGFQHKYTYTMRTISNIENEFVPLEDTIRNTFLPALLNGHICNDEERRLFSLPVKQGGLAIQNPIGRSPIEYYNSREATAAMVEKVKQQEEIYDQALEISQVTTVRKLNSDKIKRNQDKLERLKQNLSDPINERCLEASMEKGASNWLTTLPIKQYGFLLDKQSFWDSLYIRYNIPLKRLPPYCVCGALFKLDHVLSCPKGGFIALRHNEIRDVTADALSECCKDVAVEPVLQEVTGEDLPPSAIKSDEARVDVAARGFWVKGQVAYLDVKVFNPTAKTYLTQTLQASHRSNENAKKRSYNRRVNFIDHGSFTPLVFTCFGGMAKECLTFYNRLAEMIAEKRDDDINVVKNWLRTRLSFSLLRSQLLCLRGSRSAKKIFAENDDMSLITAESFP